MAPPNVLPLLVSETPFVGREDALAFLEGAEPSGPRAIFVTGAAGIGKTRLLQHYLGRASRSRGARVLWCELEEALRPEEALHRIAGVLDLELARSTEEDCASILGERLNSLAPVWLVLDHVDPLIGEIVDWAERWTSLGGTLKVLVTAREAPPRSEHFLHLPLRPLRLPPRSTTIGSELLRAEAAQLFVTRARRAAPQWQLDDDNHRIITEIVRRIGGLPLGLELAAARLATLTPKELLERLPARLELLRAQRRSSAGSSSTSTSPVVRPRSRPTGPRPRSRLSSTISWTWEMLPPWEQSALAQTAVFRGGFTLEAAAAVVELGRHREAPELSQVLEALQQKSLLREHTGALDVGAARLYHAGPIREFAEEQLRRSGLQERMQARHASHFLAWGRMLAAEVDGHGGARRRRLLEQETENLLAVVRAALATEPLSAPVLERALRGVLVLEPVLATRGPFQVHLMLLDAGLSASPIDEVDALLRAQVLESRGRVRRARGLNEESLADLEQALHLARAKGNDYWILRTLANIGTHHVLAGQLALAEAIYDDLVPLMSRVGDRRLEGRSYSFLGTLRRRQGCNAEARSCYEQALSIHRREGDRRYEGITLGELAALVLAQGQAGQGTRLLGDALEIHQEVGNKRFEGAVRYELARVCLEAGQLDDGRRHATLALTLYRDVADRVGEGRVRAHLGEVLARQHHLDEAREQFDRASSLFQRGGEKVDAIVCLTQCATVEAALGRRDLALASYEDAVALGANLEDATARRALEDCRAFLAASDETSERRGTAAPIGVENNAATAPVREDSSNGGLLQAAIRGWKSLRRSRSR